MKNRIIKITKFATQVSMAITLAVPLCLARPALAGNNDISWGSPACSQILLGTFEDIYWRWTLGAITVPVDKNGNAVAAGVVLMPVPSTAGDGTPGSLDVTLKPQQSFMLPLWVLLGTSYSDGTPSDRFVNPDIFKTLHLTLTIDDKTIINSRNLSDYFSGFRFHPPISYNSPPVQAVIWLQGIGMLHQPLSLGKHVIKLDAKNTIALPPYLGGGIIEYHNTWNLTVQR